MRSAISAMLLLLSTLAFSQDTIDAEKESLGSIPIGKAANQVWYSSDEEGFWSPGSPYVDGTGRLIFGSRTRNNRFLIFDGSGFSELNPKAVSNPIQVGPSVLVSQQGIGVVSSSQYQFLQDSFLKIDYHSKDESFDGESNYPAPWGALIYSENQKGGIAVVFDIGSRTGEFTIIDQTRLNSWLPTQIGDFSIGQDGLLYRNGVQWSAAVPESLKGKDFQFVGRLISGHLIWSDGPEKVVITNAHSDVELVVTAEYKGYTEFGVGPWGEIYCLVGPALVPGKDRSGNDIWTLRNTGSAELVVLRNYLRYFGRLKEGGVRLRQGPSTLSEILGIYPAKTGFRIIEKGTEKFTIAGQTDAWYKVRLLDGKEG